MDTTNVFISHAKDLDARKMGLAEKMHWFLLVNKSYKYQSLGTNKMDPSLLFLLVNHSTIFSFLLLTHTTKGLLKSTVESLPQSYKHKIQKSIVWKSSNIHYFGKHC